MNRPIFNIRLTPRLPVWLRGSWIALVFLQFGVSVSAGVVEELERANSTAERLDRALIEQAADEATLREKSIDGLVERFSNSASDTTLNDRTRANAFLTVAHLQWQYGRLDEAVEAVEKALLMSESIDVLVTKARLLDAKGDEAQADEWYAKAEELAAGPEELEFMAIRRAMIKADEDNIQSLLELANKRDQTFKNRAAVAVALLGHPDKAIVLYQPEPESEHYDRQLVRVTEWALSALDFDLAKEMSWRAYDASEALANKLYALALVMESFRRSESLPELLPLLATRIDDDPDIRRLQVDVFAETELYDDAIEQYRSLPAGIGAASTRQELISLYESAGRTDDMVAEYQLMIESDPTQVLWYYGLARHYVNEARSDDAKEIWRTFAENNQANAEILVSGADYMLKMGFVDEATNMLEEHSSTYGPSPAIFLFTFGNHFNRGNFELAEDAIEEFESDLDSASADLFFVADAYERLQRYEPAIDVYRKLQTARGKLSYDNRMRLAWLYSVAGQKEKALEAWQSIWLDVESPARRSFAESQLLMISAELAMIADIVVDLEEKLYKRIADRNEINLLVRIYTEIGDDFSATEVVEEYARYGDMDEIAKLKQLSNVYLQLSQYDRYDEVLKKLEQLDPENRIEHIQNIVLNLLAHDLATDRSEKYDEIQEWLEELRNFDSEAVSGEFEASVLSMGGFEKEAIESYRRALIEQPKHSDNLLLMADLMKNLNRVDEAVALLQYVAEHAEDDNEFVVAVDGIINMIGQRRFGQNLSEEKQAVFRWAHRIILERITGRDEKFYLYTLLSEIANETNNTEAEFRAIENSLPSAGLRRAAILRELMTMATPDAGFTFERNEGDPARQLRFGRRLIALRQELPPEVFINIGRTLLTQGDTHNAQKSFEMIKDITGLTDVNKTTADLFFEEGYDDSALSFYAEALATDQSNIELLLKMALLREFRAQFDVANSLYLSALRILLASQPATLANKPESPTTPTIIRQSSVDTSVTREYRQYYEVLAHGFLMTWPEEDRTLYDTVVSDLRALLNEELERVASSFSADERITYSRYSRLNRIQQFLTRVARSTSNQELATYVQTSVAKLFEDDEEVADLGEQHREFWGVKNVDQLDDEGVSDVSRLQLEFDDAVENGDLAGTIQLARLLSKEELIYTELLKRVNDGDIASAVRFGKHSLHEAQYRQLISVAVARLEDEQKELLTFIDNEPAAVEELERVVGRELISADDLLIALQSKRLDLQSDPAANFFGDLANGYWIHLTRRGRTNHRLDFLDYTIDNMDRSSDRAIRDEMQVNAYVDDLLQLNLAGVEQERLYGLLQDYIDKLDLKDEYRMERTAFSLVLKLDADFSTNSDLIARLAQNWRERTQQDYLTIVDAFYRGGKDEALDHCINMIIDENHQSRFQFKNLVGHSFQPEILAELNEIVANDTARVSVSRVRTLYQLHTNVTKRWDGSYSASSHGHLPTNSLKKLVEQYPDDDELGVILILGLLRDGRDIDAERKMRSYVESHPDDAIMRAAYYLHLIKNERFVTALQLVEDGGENLLDAETLEALSDTATEGYGSSAFTSNHVFLHVHPPSTGSSMFWLSNTKRLDEAVDELRNSNDPLTIQSNLRKAWRGSLVASATSERYGIVGNFSYIYQYLSSLPFDPASTIDFGASIERREPTFETILEQAEVSDEQSLFQHIARNVAIGDVFESYLRTEKNANRRHNENFYFDLVDFYIPHEESMRQRLAGLTRKLELGRLGDHEFTLWMLLWNQSNQDVALNSFDIARDRFNAILQPTRLQVVHFAQVADSFGEFGLANDLYRLFVANASRGIHLGTNVIADQSGSIPMNLAMLVNHVIEFDDEPHRDDLLNQILIASGRIDATPVTRVLHDAFVLRSLSKSVTGTELLNAAKDQGINLGIGDETEVDSYVVPKAVELARAHATAGDFEQAVQILHTLLTADESSEDEAQHSRFLVYPSMNDPARKDAMLAASLNGYYDLNMYINIYGAYAAQELASTIRRQFLLQRERLVVGLSESWRAHLVDTLVDWVQSTDTLEEDFLDCVLALMLEVGKQGSFEQFTAALETMTNGFLQRKGDASLKFQLKLVELMLALDLPPNEKLVADLIAGGFLDSEQRLRVLRLYIDHPEDEVSKIVEILDRGDGGLNLLLEIQGITGISQDTDRPDEITERIANLESAKEALLL